jgi:hypothetical protein
MKICGIETAAIAKIDGIAYASIAGIDGIAAGPPVYGFKTEWTVAGDATARTITLPLYNSGVFDCTVSWGDGTADSTITTYDDADRAHEYASDGTYNVEIVGECPGWSFNNAGDRLKITDILYWGDDEVFGGFQYLSAGFYGCENLKSVGNEPIIAKAALTSVYRLFQYCYALTSIPDVGLLDNCINITSAQSLFYYCNNIISGIPPALFKYNTALETVYTTFARCEKLTGDISEDLFLFNVALKYVGTAFSYCQKFEGTIPEGLFRANPEILSMIGVFSFCPLLSGSIPQDLFRYNTKVNNMESLFKGCYKLTGTIPVGLFAYNPLVTTFQSAFSDCRLITYAPAELFRPHTLTTTFYQTFSSCYALQVDPEIFYLDGEQSTRFLNRSINFQGCFYRNTFTGVQGEAPDLWNCTYGTGTPISYLCFAGSANGITTLSNWYSIPEAWGGTPV